MSNSAYENTQLAVAVCIGAKVPVILWGAPGQGKTSELNAIAKNGGFVMKTVLASIREPSDFAGLPNIVINPKTSCASTQLIAPDWAQKIAEVTANGGKAMLFFDEISTAPPATQAAMLRVALDRVAGDLYLGDEVSIVAAANPPEMAADGWDLAAPMANRFVHINWDLPADVVQEGFLLGWPKAPTFSANNELVNLEIQSARLLVGSFLGTRTELVTKMPSQNSQENGRAFPTPRSWEMAAKLYGYAKAVLKGNDIVIRLLVNGCVGQAASTEFLEYVSKMDLPDPEKLLKDPKFYKFDTKTRSDIVYVIGASVIAAVKNRQPVTKERWNSAGAVFTEIVKAQHTDIAVALAIRWMADDIRMDKHWMPADILLMDLIPILEEARILS